MVCREIMSCPVVSRLRGDLSILRVVFCETCSEPCQRSLLTPLRQELEETLLPDGTILCAGAQRLRALPDEATLG